MAVRIRLKRIGRRHRACFRLAATDARCPRDGAVIEELGTYDPANKVPERQVDLRTERLQHWLKVGAVPSDTVRRLLVRAGLIGK